jgi:tRNA nucleotidyltransferase (CCA-adding enzyme)
VGEPVAARGLRAPESVVQIARTLEKAGFSTWAVGGAVRDALAGNTPEDWDLTTAARPRDVQRLFRRTAPVGIAHGTVGVIVKGGEMYEVTTFRRDVETFGRHARVAFADTLEEDLSRRDFTINAVAWHPLTHEIRDPYEGVADLQRGILRTVGDPAERFQEDRLRVLRALRFAGRFGLEIEPATWRAIVDYADDLDALSVERIREELWKILEGKAPPSRALDLYARSGVLRELYPELDRCRGVPSESGADVWNLTLRVVDATNPPRPGLRMAALLHQVGACQMTEGAVATSADDEALRGAAVAMGIMRRLKASNADTDLVTHLVAQHASAPSAGSSDAEIRRWIRRIGREYLDDLFRLLFAIDLGARDGAGRTEVTTLRARVDQILAARVPISITELAIDGSDLRALGIAPGPVYGEILRDLLERVTDEVVPNDRTRLLEVVREHHLA